MTGLSETLEPLVRLIEDVATTGANTAQVMYKVSKTAATPNGRPPWVVHHKYVVYEAISVVCPDAFAALTNGARLHRVSYFLTSRGDGSSPLLQLTARFTDSGLRVARGFSRPSISIIYGCSLGQSLEFPSHFVYSFNPSDMAFAKRVYPLFQGASDFFLQTLQQHPNNTDWLVTNPRYVQ